MDKQQSGFLKLIAIVAMTIDHIRVGFYPEVELLRSIGRVVFPLFAFRAVLSLAIIYIKDRLPKIDLPRYFF